MASQDLVLVGVITGAHGIRGEVKLKSFTAVPDAIVDYNPLLTRDGGKIELSRLRPQKDGFIAAVRGITDRNRSEALKGTELFVARERLPATEADEVYLHDLIGSEVFTSDGKKLGHVVAHANYGAGNLIDVRIEGRAKTVLIPFAEGFIVEAGAGRIVADLPEGFLDEGT